jgi:hypothetical protein
MKPIITILGHLEGIYQASVCKAYHCTLQKQGTPNTNLQAAAHQADRMTVCANS